jgi:FAD/FMN-containing dehydrogenase
VDTLISLLRVELGDDGVLTGAAVSGRAAGIWRSDNIAAAAIVRPATTGQVAAVLRACNDAGQSIVTHGGLTGLVEGALAGPADIVLSTERLKTIEAVSATDRTMRVQAGVRLQDAQERAAAEGLMLGLDLGARGSCTVGGNVATNAGGNQVIRYGMAREAVLGLEAVLADGTVITSLNEMLKNNAGYDLKQLFIGSEGTLGVITRVVLRLRPAWRSQETALLACQDFTRVAELLTLLDSALGGTLSSFEVFWRNYYELVIEDNDKPPLPAGSPFYVLVEALGGSPDGDRERFLDTLEQAGAAGLYAEAMICKSGAERRSLWALRDSVDKTLDYGEAYIFDVSLRLSVMQTYVDKVLQQLDATFVNQRSWVFGHAGDGNLHFVVAPGTDKTGQNSDSTRRQIEEILYEPLREWGGSISGEHGIGLEKKRWLSVTRNAAEVELMRRLKATLDPRGILNPGRIFDT